MVTPANFRKNQGRFKKSDYICILEKYGQDSLLIKATLAQSVEQLIRNEQVEGSSPLSGSEQRPCGLCFFYQSLNGRNTGSTNTTANTEKSIPIQFLRQNQTRTPQKARRSGTESSSLGTTLSYASSRASSEALIFSSYSRSHFR